MPRAIQFTIGRYLIVVPVIGYLCAFPELAVLLGIFVATLTFVAPVLVLSYLGCRYLGPRPVGNDEPAAALAVEREIGRPSLDN